MHLPNEPLLLWNNESSRINLKMMKDEAIFTYLEEIKRSLVVLNRCTWKYEVLMPFCRQVEKDTLTDSHTGLLSCWPSISLL